MKRILGFLLAGAAVTTTANAQDEMQAEVVEVGQVVEVIEPKSNRAYPVELTVADGAVHTLMGIGIRTKTFLNVKVYAVGLYVDVPGAQDALRMFVNKSAKELQKDKAFYATLLQRDFGMTLRLVMTRDVDGETMANAFDEALGPRVERAASEMDMPGGTEALSQFQSYFDVGKLTDDSKLVFTCTPDGTLYTTIQGTPSEAIPSPTLCWALFDVYFGEKPISKGAKKDMIAGVADILAGEGAM